MREITYAEAIREALREEMKRDDKVYICGEDVGRFGGCFGVTKGLWEEFGDDRVRDTPISETAIIGSAVGAAATGMRPVAEIMFCDFMGVAMDEITNQAAKMRYMFGGKVKLPMVIRTPVGGGLSAAAQHSQSLEAWFTHLPGLKVVMPSTPYDAKGLLKASIRDDNPVVFLEHKMLYGFKGPVPEEEYIIPLGVADIKREGKDLTIIATSLMVHKALDAASILEKDGFSVEVVDPRTLYPLDEEKILASVRKTHRAVVVHEAVERNGFGGEIVSIIMEKAFEYLDAPVKRVCGKNVPIPFSPPLERFVIPQVEDIIKAAKSIL
ncbi:MAG: alpha-ketoacid dehydrogenase subunit beta [Synergistetes bacterium]|nr:alpha-ketoacid dehydrogenase subunit beta [Synergistota bacterium]MCX8127739.1 alpha-ketoacid dehydrogenase subunit beta [Synergistota bacterium]MDW8191346.1 alpha-ketoacid dehydrogenase subunit beta [Synergistota bacterium]